jgi:hypothetical protein
MGIFRIFTSSTEGMGSPAYEILIFLNFLTIILGTLFVLSGIEPKCERERIAE